VGAVLIVTAVALLLIVLWKCKRPSKGIASPISITAPYKSLRYFSLHSSEISRRCQYREVHSLYIIQAVFLHDIVFVAEFF